MSKLYRWGALIALAALMVLPAQAQTEEPETAPAEEPEVVIVVTAEKTAQPASESIASATVITAKQIKEQGAQTVADVLRMVPGVTMRQSGGAGSRANAFVRGTKSNQILVLVDGQRISTPAFISTDLSKLPITDVSRVEVIRGPVSSLYGSEAIGGVINIITKRPTGSSGDLALGFGNHGRQERSLSLRSANEKMSWQFMTSVPVYEGPRVNSDYSATYMSGQVTLPSVKGWEVALNAQNYNDSLGLPGAVSWPDPDDHQWWKRSSIGITGTRDMFGGQVQWNLYHNRQRLVQENPDAFVPVSSKITGVTDAGEITYRWEAGRNSWVTGAELRDEDYTDVQLGVQRQDQSISNQAIFVQDRLALSDKLDTVLGLRLDDQSTAGSKLIPRAGITYALRPGMNLRASYSGGYRAPTLVELYYKGDYGYGNPDLTPESSHQYEVGLSIQREKDTYDFALFTNNVKDQIEWIEVDDGNPLVYTGSYANISRARQRGLEIAWSHRFRNSVNLGLSYTYVEAVNRTTGQQLLGVPRNHLTLAVAGMVKSWQVGLAGRWTSDTPDFGGVADSHTVFDLTLQREGDKPTNPYITVRNLFNTSYEEVYGYPAEGASIEAGMRTTW